MDQYHDKPKYKPYVPNNVNKTEHCSKLFLSKIYNYIAVTSYTIILSVNFDGLFISLCEICVAS